MASADRCLELFTIVKSKYNLPFELKLEQLNILNLLLDGKNVLGVLPTGFGKSATFVLTPLLFDEVSSS